MTHLHVSPLQVCCRGNSWNDDVPVRVGGATWPRGTKGEGSQPSAPPTYLFDGDQTDRLADAPFLPPLPHFLALIPPLLPHHHAVVALLLETVRKQTLEGDPARPGDSYLVSVTPEASPAVRFAPAGHCLSCCLHQTSWLSGLVRFGPVWRSEMMTNISNLSAFVLQSLLDPNTLPECWPPDGLMPGEFMSNN